MMLKKNLYAALAVCLSLTAGAVMAGRADAAPPEAPRAALSEPARP